jgi:hypothetical protein
MVRGCKKGIVSYRRQGSRAANTGFGRQKDGAARQKVQRYQVAARKKDRKYQLAASNFKLEMPTPARKEEGNTSY